MATLENLKQALRQEAGATTSSRKQPLSDLQYSAGFDILVQNSGWMTYQEFIIPQLSQLLYALFNSRIQISVLEVGPGPKSVFGYLPGPLRRKIKKFTAFEPNSLFAARLKEWLCPASETEPSLPCLESPPIIHTIPFVVDEDVGSASRTNTSANDEKYDIILFCHSMYGMNPKRKFVEHALEKLIERPQSGMVVVFHRDENLNFDGLVCHQTTTFPNGAVSVANDESVLDCFAPFIAGFVMQDVKEDEEIRVGWRKVCRAMGRHKRGHPDHLSFSSPDIMVSFTKHATVLSKLMVQVPLVKGNGSVKNRDALIHLPASVVKPTEVRHVQQCVEWAQRYELGLTIIGGGHSGHCLWPSVVAIDMGAFNQVHLVTAGKHGGDSEPDPDCLIVAEAGCKTGDIVREAMAAGLTLPLGARPSIGAGLWLQGGIGHLARLHGLACDAIVGVVMVSVESSQVLCIGRVPSQHQPTGAVRVKNESDLLWVMKGAGTNFGIVLSVTFRAYAVQTYLVRNWIVPLKDSLDARKKLNDFDKGFARELPRNCSADAYLYWNADQLYLGVTMFESSTASLDSTTAPSALANDVWGPVDKIKAVDSIGLFETEMYMSGTHIGHSGLKTSSFKRCLFLKNVGEVNVAGRLIAAIMSRPSSLCYLHLLQGGGAVSDIAANETAFGCRDWDFACIITGVWPRDQDGTPTARLAVMWVYQVARDLLSLSSGAYGADLGPDPRDTVLAFQAFGTNRLRLARLKQLWDPHNVLAYACPLLKVPMEPKLIILVTGESCSGKDYCAEVWVSVLIKYSQKSLIARAVSISIAIKREYAMATGADLNLLLYNRAYKEQHRPALTAFFQRRVRQQPRLLEEQFLNVIYGAANVDVLIITGMRDEAPVAALSHLVSDSRLLEVHVRACDQMRRIRKGCHRGDDGGSDDSNDSNNSELNVTALNYRPSLIFDNDVTGNEAAEQFANRHFLHFFHEDLEQLEKMVRQISDFPSPEIKFRHVLGISQQPGGLALSTSLLQNHFMGDWDKVDALACCEAGGFVFASALALRIDVPLVLIREAGKLPPPTVSAMKPTSHISSFASNHAKGKRIEVERDAISPGASVVVVDDVLSSGETICAVLQLLSSIGVKDFSIMVVAEFPVHRGREFLRQRGFGHINIQSLLVIGGA